MCQDSDPSNKPTDHNNETEPRRIMMVTGQHAPGNQLFFLTVAGAAPALLSHEARRALGKRVQQMPGGPGLPRCYHFHGLRGRDERVVVYDNGVTGLVPDDEHNLLAHPVPGVFASIGALSLRIVPVGDPTDSDWIEAWEVIVIENDPALPVALPDLNEPELAAEIAADLAASPEDEDDHDPGDLDPPAEPDGDGTDEEIAA